MCTLVGHKAQVSHSCIAVHCVEKNDVGLLKPVGALAANRNEWVFLPHCILTKEITCECAYSNTTQKWKVEMASSGQCAQMIRTSTISNKGIQSNKFIPTNILYKGDLKVE